MYKLNLFLDQILWLHIAIFIVSNEWEVTKDHHSSDSGLFMTTIFSPQLCGSIKMTP